MYNQQIRGSGRGNKPHMDQQSIYKHNKVHFFQACISVAEDKKQFPFLIFFNAPVDK